MKNRTSNHPVRRSVDLSSNVTGMFRRAGSDEMSAAISLGAEDFVTRKNKTLEYKQEEEGNDCAANISPAVVLNMKHNDDDTNHYGDEEVDFKTFSIPAGSALQAVRKSSKLAEVDKTPMRNFPNFPGDDDLTGLFVQLADQTRTIILQSKSLDAASIQSPYFTDLPAQHQIILIQKCLATLLRKPGTAANATFLLDITLHALIRSMVPLLSQEIISEKESGRVASNVDSEEGMNSDDEDCEAEKYCKHRTFVLAFYELSTESMSSLPRSSTDLKLWLSLIDDITLCIFNASPKLLTAMETRCGETDEVVARMLSASEMHNPDWKDLYFADTVIADKYLETKNIFENKLNGVGCSFWPRERFTPDDLRFANLCLAALNFEDTTDASFFTPFPMSSYSKSRKEIQKAERERIDAIKEAVMLLKESEDSANDAQAHAKEMVRIAETALSRRKGGTGSAEKRETKLKGKLHYAKQQEKAALEIREEQCRDLIQAISLLLRAVSQQSEVGWVWRWQENGGRHPTNYAVRLQATQTVRPYLVCTDFVFNLSGESLWDYMMFAHSLCATPDYLWDHLE